MVSPRVVATAHQRALRRREQFLRERHRHIAVIEWKVEADFGPRPEVLGVNATRAL